MRQPVPFGKYLLLDRISVGGMAEVFKAKSYGVEGFEKIIAIKRILPTMGEDRDFIKMFIDEAKIAGQLAHANICQIFELGRIDGSHFIAMEYIWGKDLLQIQNRLRKLKQEMPVSMACFSIAKVLEGLDYAHRKRDPLGRPLEIVHRDCSPQNVLVSYEGEVKVIDFGIAKATSRNSRTMAGVLKGKFGYMSPEQVRGLPLDRRSDIFALGTMLYECLTGERLFQGETDFSTLEKVRNVDIRPPRELNPRIPEAVERVILKALAKDVDERYQWCSEMLADLQQYLMSQDVVFTAKSLSSWLKQVFSTEIDKERQQLEQYKRVGRDGLIAGVPSAEAKLDVVANLGEAGEPEGDATMLGSPDFDDVESAVAAGSAPEVGPAPGSPAVRGQAQSDEDGDFGEEAPTEIFGEIEHGKPAQPQPAAIAAQPRPSALQSKPPRSPPAPPALRPVAVPSHGQPGMAAGPGGQQVRHTPGPNHPMPVLTSGVGDSTVNAADLDIDELAVRNAYPQNAPQVVAAPPVAFVAQNYPPVSSPQMLAGTSAEQPSSVLASLGNEGLGKTLMGAAPPPGLPNYSQGYPPSTMGQQPAPVSGYPQPYSPSVPAKPTSAGTPQQGYAQAAPYGSGQPGQGYAQPSSYQQSPPPAPVEQLAPSVEGKKRSSIGRDIAIGVAIAGLVLGGFLAVKFLVLDTDDGKASDASGSTSSIATIQLTLPAGVSADLFVDDKKIATVSDKQEIPVTAGQRKVKLVGPNGARCEQELKLPAGKTTPLECVMAGDGSGQGSAATGSGATGSGATGSGSSASSTGSGGASPVIMGSGSAKPSDTADTSDAKAPDKMVTRPGDKTAPKATDDKPVKGQSGKPNDRTPPEDRTPKPAAATDKGYLVLTSKPSAKISVDGVDTGLSTPITGKTLTLTPGKHKITFSIGNDKFTFAVMIKAGATETLSKDLQ